MKLHKLQCRLMGSAFELGVVCNSELDANLFLKKGQKIIQKLESDLSEFLPESFTSKINAAAGKSPVEVNKETFDCIVRANNIASLTHGYFDLTTAALKALYQFKNTNFSMPEKKVIRKVLRKVGYRNLILKSQVNTVFLPEVGMKISFAGIGKGYAADKVLAFWKSEGLESGYVNASGDLAAIGKNAQEASWRIGIAHPDRKQAMMLYIPIDNAAVATSGDYEQHFMYKGVQYGHNLNPKTGFPVSGLKSVTVISPSAELSDALATACFAMGSEKAMNFIDQLPHTFAVIMDIKNEVFFSKALHYEKVSI